MFSYEFCEISNNTFFHRTPLVSASVFNRLNVVFFVGMILRPSWYDRLSFMGFHCSHQPSLLFTEGLLKCLYKSIKSSLKSENLRIKRFLTMINLCNNAVRWWYWCKIIAILLIVGMDYQLIILNICLREPHNSRANPMIMRGYSVGSGVVVDVAFGNNCEHIPFQTSWCENPIFVIW